MKHQSESFGIVATIRRKHLILFAVILALSLFPIPLASLAENPAPFILGLPWWYWTSFVTVSVMYFLIGVILHDLNQTEAKQMVDNDSREPVLQEGGE